jgi:hypothetical protein
MKQIVIILLLSSCIGTGMQQIISSKDVKSIEISNGTNNRKIAKKMVITDRSQLDWIVHELNAMKLLDREVGVKSNFGEYEMTIEINNNKEMQFLVVYTTYNGVVILGPNKLGTAMDQYYKNDDLERAILHLFQTKRAFSQIAGLPAQYLISKPSGVRELSANSHRIDHLIIM